MELNWEHVLNCLSDPLTPVRSTDGRLLGAVPKIADDHPVPYVTDANGVNFEIRIAAQACVVVDLRSQVVTNLPGFVPLAGANFSHVESPDERAVRQLREGEVPPGANPDVGTAI